MSRIEQGYSSVELKKAEFKREPKEIKRKVFEKILDPFEPTGLLLHETDAVSLLPILKQGILSHEYVNRTIMEQRIGFDLPSGEDPVLQKRLGMDLISLYSQTLEPKVYRQNLDLSDHVHILINPAVPAFASNEASEDGFGGWPGEVMARGKIETSNFLGIIIGKDIVDKPLYEVILFSHRILLNKSVEKEGDYYQMRRDNNLIWAIEAIIKTMTELDYDYRDIYGRPGPDHFRSELKSKSRVLEEINRMRFGDWKSKSNEKDPDYDQKMDEWQTKDSLRRKRFEGLARKIIKLYLDKITGQDTSEWIAKDLLIFLGRRYNLPVYITGRKQSYGYEPESEIPVSIELLWPIQMSYEEIKDYIAKRKVSNIKQKS